MRRGAADGMAGMFPAIRLQPDGEADAGDAAVRLPAAGLLAFNQIRRSEKPAPARDLEQPERAASSAPRPIVRVSGIGLLVEKIPFLLVSAAFSVVAVVAQSRNGAVRNFTMLPLWVRLENAAVAYVAYLGKAFFPHNLAIYYPHAGPQLSGSDVSAAAAILAAVSVCAIFWRRRHPYLLGGMGLVSRHTRADDRHRASWLATDGRSLYLLPVDRPLHCARLDRAISLFSPFASMGSLGVGLVRAVAISIVALLAATTWVQIGYWRDLVTLSTHALNSTADSAFMENQLGGALLQQGRAREAIAHLELAARSEPPMRQPQYNLGIAFAQLGRMDQAVVHFRAALAINDGYSAAHYQLGLVENELGHYTEAQEHLRRTIEINPELVDAHMNLAIACLSKRRQRGSDLLRPTRFGTPTRFDELPSDHRAGSGAPGPISGSDWPVAGRFEAFPQ